MDLSKFKDMMVYNIKCPRCGKLNRLEDEFCQCGERNPEWNEWHTDKCCNPECLFPLAEPTDKYCRYCGTQATGTYNPIVSAWEYGPLDDEPVNRKHICYQCAYTWWSFDEHEQYYHKCGGKAPALQ